MDIKNIFKKATALSLVLLFALYSFSLCAFAQSPKLNIINLKFEDASQYGYSDYQLIDSEGNSINLSSASKPSVSLFGNSLDLDIPSSYDSRNNNVVTSVKCQGYSGNCWSFSTLSALESDSISQGLSNTNIDFSEAHHVWFNERLLTNNQSDKTYGDGYTATSPYETGGNWLTAIRSLSRWSGIANESDFPFSPFNLSSMGNYNESERYNTESGIILNSAEVLTNTNSVKEWIMKHGSVTMAMYFDLSYLYEINNLSSYYQNTNTTINHQVAVVGWDDDYSRNNFNPNNRPAAKGAWLVKNSFGTEYGMNGYHWVSYCDTSLKNFVGFTSQAKDLYYKNYTYNGAGYGSIISNTGSASIANIFKAEQEELLSALATYTATPNNSLEISIYTNLPSNYSSPISGTLTQSWTTVIKNAGYHTINIPEDIQLAKNTYFSIVIKFLNENGISYVPVEVNNKNNMTYFSNTKESYVNLPQYNQGWYDAKSYGLNNVCIQAFTKCNHSLSTIILKQPLCTVSGSKKNVCVQCGMETAIEQIPQTGHKFSDWSEYKYNTSTGEKERHRECEYCGYIVSETMSTGRNTITIDELFNLIFEMIIAYLRNIFVKAN